MDEDFLTELRDDLADELSDEPTKKTRAVVTKEALRPPPLPREARETREQTQPITREMMTIEREANAVGVQSNFVYEYRILEQLVDLKTRMAKVERRLLYLAAVIVLAGKLDLAKIIEVAKALASAP